MDLAIILCTCFWQRTLFRQKHEVNIPESGNGIPDILDEAKWELDFILKMQDQTGGGFYHMVQPSNSVAPDKDTTPRYIADVNGSQTNVRPTDDAACAAAALAEASISFEQFDPIYANTLLTALVVVGITWLRTPITFRGLVLIMSAMTRRIACGRLRRFTGRPARRSIISTSLPTINSLRASGMGPGTIPRASAIWHRPLSWST